MMKHSPSSSFYFTPFGNLFQQIINQASFQIFFSADILYVTKVDHDVILTDIGE